MTNVNLEIPTIIFLYRFPTSNSLTFDSKVPKKLFLYFVSTREKQPLCLGRHENSIIRREQGCYDAPFGLRRTENPVINFFSLKNEKKKKSLNLFRVICTIFDARLMVFFYLNKIFISWLIIFCNRTLPQTD